MTTPTLSTGNESIARDAVLRSELKALTEETIEMNKFRAYFNGNQPLVYSTDLFKRVFGTAFVGFRDNWMKVIINAVNFRLKLINFHFEKDEQGELAKKIWDVMRLNEINIQQRDLHEGTLVENRAFMLVWPDDELGARLDWQPGQICRIFYDPDRRTKPLWAVKRWTVETGEIFVTFYTPEFVFKYTDTSATSNRTNRKPSSSSALTEVPGVGWFGNLEVRLIDGEDWPLPNPYGRVPIVEFNNTSYRSELEDAVPQQDALNKTLLDMMVTGEFQGFPQRAIETLGSEPDGGWVAGPGEVWVFRPTQDHEGKHIPTQFHTFKTADPSTYMQPIGMWLQHMALTSSTPVRMFFQSDRGGRGDSPSGDSLLVDDKTLNDKVVDKHDRLGNRWLDVARLIADSIGVENAFSLVGEAVWQDPRHDYQLSVLLEGVKMIEIGMPVEFVVTKLAFTPGEVVELLKMIKEQKEEQEKREREALAIAKTTATVSANQPASDVSPKTPKSST